MSDTNCLLSVFHFLIIENIIAINVDTNGTAKPMAYFEVDE
jgi:hypothetical protein